jgi:predicted ABC-type transport system involved in lysophospholipase L1 biosynthesis ATPase subunit
MVTHDQHLAREAKRIVQMFDGEISSDVVNGE